MPLQLPGFNLFRQLCHSSSCDKKKTPSVNHMTGWLQMRNLTIRIMATAEQPDEAELRFIIVSSCSILFKVPIIYVSSLNKTDDGGKGPFTGVELLCDVL